MTTELLFVVVIVQTGMLVVMSVVLSILHKAGLVRDQKRGRELRRAREIVRLNLSKRLLEEEAREELGSMSSRTLAALLNEFSGHQTGEGRERVFALLRGTTWYEELGKRARSRFWWRRLRAVRSIATLAQPEHLLIIHERLDDPTPAVRVAAAAGLGRLASPGLANAILERATQTHGAERNHLVEILAESDTLVLPEMVRRLSEPSDPDTVRVLLSLTGRLGYTSLLPYVVRHTSAEEPEVRMAAATCLRNFPHPETANALRRLLTDRGWEVRARAAASLGGIGAIEAIPDLLMSLQDTNWWVRLRSAIALRLVGPHGIEALKGVGEADDRFARDMARYVLGLDDGAMAEYVGGATIDFSSASARAAS